MKFSAADIAAMLDAVGDDAILGVTPIKVDFQAAGRIEEIEGMSVIVSTPGCLASTAQLATLEALGGPGGDTITIDSTDYRIISITDQGDGFSALALEEI